jgi:hypothetical protein
MDRQTGKTWEGLDRIGGDTCGKGQMSWRCQRGHSHPETRGLQESRTVKKNKGKLEGICWWKLVFEKIYVLLRTSKFAAFPKIYGNLSSYKDDFASENFRYNIATVRRAAAEEKRDQKEWWWAERLGNQVKRSVITMIWEEGMEDGKTEKENGEKEADA